MALTPAKWASAQGLMSIPAYGAFGVPLYGHDVVYVKSEYTQQSPTTMGQFKQNPYKVLKIYQVPLKDGSGVSFLTDLSGTAEATGASADTSPHFYTIQNVSTGLTTDKHESELVDLAGLKTYIQSELTSDWTDPAYN